MNVCSDGMPSHLADAPVAMMTVSARTVSSPETTLNGRAEKSTAVTSWVRTRVPKRTAWARNSSISSGPCTPLGKPG